MIKKKCLYSLETSSGGITPSGNINITTTQVTNVRQYATAQVVDTNLIASNIKKDVTILGVQGTYEGGGGQNKLPQAIDGSITELTKEDTNGATKILNHKFRDCTNLLSVDLASSVITIENSAFKNCAKLASLIVSDNLTTIRGYAFDYCARLNDVTLGKNITTIEGDAFRDCGALKSVTIYATTPPTISSNSFPRTLSSCKFYVPAESVEAYKVATNWVNYAGNIYAIEE